MQRRNGLAITPAFASGLLVRAVFAAASVAACGGGRAATREQRPAPGSSASALEASRVDAGVASAPDRDAGEQTNASSTSEASEPCPSDMAYVETSYCPRVQQRCVKDEYDKPNHITICHEFSSERRCLVKEREQRFCIDKYEFPNTPGAHPPVMVDWYDAMGACAQRGKRLCWESEWVAACEGPDKLPFPYGKKRDSTKCNIDNTWLEPSLRKVYSSKKDVQDEELLRLDRSMPSGSKDGCVSGFGVYDLTGNVDEWAISEDESGDSKWAILKGGAWGHVRNACRPRTKSHPPEFRYYFISFRCCADPRGSAADESSSMWKPPPVPDHPDPSGKIGPGWTPPSRP